jgi:hypothetical protein
MISALTEISTPSTTKVGPTQSLISDAMMLTLRQSACKARVLRVTIALRFFSTANTDIEGIPHFELQHSTVNR